MLRLRRAWPAVLLAIVIGGCGSSSSSSTPASSSTQASSSTPAASSTQASSSTAPASTFTSASSSQASTAPPNTANVDLKLPGVKYGTKGTLKDLTKLPKPKRSKLHPRIQGLSGLSPVSQIEALANQANSFWTDEFSQAGEQLPEANFDIIEQAATCGSSQLGPTSSPEYCPSQDTVDLPLGFVQNEIEPNGDAAVALVVEDLYGYHIENAIGMLSPSAGLTPIDLEEIDSCLSGVYFGYYLFGKEEAGDEQAVNRQLAADAAASGQSDSAATVTADQLTNAFNHGILTQGDFEGCLPSRS
jgi:putative neutral zinc metallopeptidase